VEMTRRDMRAMSLPKMVNDNSTLCVECGKSFIQERDIQLCDKCVDKFDLNLMWKMHDSNQLEALNFNENPELREKFRLPNVKMSRIRAKVDSLFHQHRNDRITLKDLVLNLCRYSDKNIRCQSNMDIFEDELLVNFDKEGNIAY